MKVINNSYWPMLIMMIIPLLGQCWSFPATP